MTDAEVKYFETENRHIWQLMGRSASWLIVAIVAIVMTTLAARRQGPKWADWAGMALSACAFSRAILLSRRVSARNRALVEFVNERMTQR